MARPISLKPSPHSGIRHAVRLMSMIHELHKAGYQRIRFSSGMSPSGLHWRCAVSHAGNFAKDGFSLLPAPPETEVARYSSGAGNRYFGWIDAPGRSARELAVMFVERLPAIATAGDGPDWPYAGWLTDALGRAELGGTDDLPVFFADYPLDLDPARLPPPPSTVR